MQPTDDPTQRRAEYARLAATKARQLLAIAERTGNPARRAKARTAAANLAALAVAIRLGVAPIPEEEDQAWD